MKHQRLLKIPSGLSDAEHRRALERLTVERLDGIEVSCYGDPSWDPDTEYSVDFLRHYAGSVRVLRLAVRPQSLAPVEALAPSLTDVCLTDPPGGLTPLDLGPLASCKQLASLSIAWRRIDLSPLGTLSALTELSLFTGVRRAVPIIAGLAGLRRLELEVGTAEDLSPLARLSGLERFAAVKIKHLANLEFLSGMPQLRVVDLNTLAKVRSLPRLAESPHLTTLVCATLPELVDLDGVLDSSLFELALINCNVPLEALRRVSTRLASLRHLVLSPRSGDARTAASYFPERVLRSTTRAFEEYGRARTAVDCVAFR